MKIERTDQEIDAILDELTTGIRSEDLPDSVVDGAGQRVWQRLAGETMTAGEGSATVSHLRNCADFQSLIPAYLAGSLLAARTMLLEDHFGECVPCRRALKAARHGDQTARHLAFQKEKVDRSASRLAALKWGIAAAAVLAIGLLSWPLWQRLSSTFGSLNGVVEAADGQVYRVTGQRTEAVTIGERVRVGESLRTARGARALVRLSDGSTIEMRERSEFGFAINGTNPTLDIARGGIIVDSATRKGRTGADQIVVKSGQARATVGGTIFSIEHGTKGDRFSVIDGEVHVDQSGDRRTLQPGDQMTTHLSIERVPIRQEVAWSRNAARYNQMLDEVAALRKQIDQQVSLPGNRFSTQLLDLMPERTSIYLGIPNISTTLAEADRLLAENIEKSPELKAWWENEQAGTNGRSGRRGIDQALAFARDFGSYLGNEITFGAEIDPQNKRNGDFLLLADLRDANGLRSFIEKKISASGVDPVNAAKVVVIDDPRSFVAPANTTGRGDRIYIWPGQEMLAASPQIEALQRLAARIDSPVTRSFTTNAFHAKIAEIYREGAGLLIAADLEHLIVPALEADNNSADDTAFARQLGFDNLRSFIVEVKEKDGRPYNRAVVSFRKNDHGITSWLAQPGSMGALEFISPNASLVSAFVVRDPAAIVDDLFSTLRSTNPKSWDEIQAFQTTQGIDLRKDLAAPLGGEYAFAIDGPLLPIPSWKAVFEVDDPERLQQTLETVFAKIDQRAKAAGKQGFASSKEVDGERTFYKVKSLDFGLEVDYLFAHGYLIAGPSRTLVENALRFRESGNSILQSAKFKATLPEDRQANFSAIVYQNLGSITKTLGQLGGSRGAAINALLNGKAGLAYVYAFDDRMIFSVNSEDGPLGISPSDFLALPGANGLGGLLRLK